MFDANMLMPMLMGMNKNTGNSGMDMNAMASMMSAMQGGGNPIANAQGATAQNNTTAPTGGGMDMNAMASMMSAMQGGGQNPMGNMQGATTQNSTTAPTGGGMDMNAMASMMSAMQGGGQNPMANMLPMLMSMMNGGGQSAPQPPINNTYNNATPQHNTTQPTTQKVQNNPKPTPPQDNYCHYYQGENLGAKKR